MDPTACLKELREFARGLKQILDGEEKHGEHLLEIADTDLNHFLDLFDGLDGWMSKGGYLPAQWSTKQ